MALASPAYTIDSFGSAERAAFLLGLADATKTPASAFAIAAPLRALQPAGRRRLQQQGAAAGGAAGVLVSVDARTANATAFAITLAQAHESGDLLTSLQSAGLGSLTGVALTIAPPASPASAEPLTGERGHAALHTAFRGLRAPSQV